ncbi:MAG: PQQ-like beta-propeller repeat protein, partial [Candidatus Coatesbacteria bacterium]|nr:PQQ-like beta-propeller repeat protein [Candidatus Coatesbacteria bacterium]
MKCLLLSCFICLAVVQFAAAGPFWPMFQHDPAHTGVAPVSTPESLELLWAASSYFGSGGDHLVTAEGGGVWVVDGTTVTRLGSRGEIAARCDFSADIWRNFLVSGSPAVLGDGTLITMGQVRNEQRQWVATLYAIEANGDVRWTLPFDGQTSPVASLVTLGSDGQIYAAGPTCLYSISQERIIAWSYACDGYVETIPAVATDGSVYFGARNSTVYCLTPEGLLRWTFCPPGTASSIDSAPTLDDNGRVYFAVSGNGFYCLNSDGSVQFLYPLMYGSACYTSPILMPDGSVVFYEMTRESTEYGVEVTRFNPDGSKRWGTPLPTDQAPLSSPAADQDGNIFVSFITYGASLSTMCFQFGRVDSDGNYTSVYSELDQIGAAGGPCIGADGTVYCHLARDVLAFGRRQGTSIEIRTDSPGYAGWLRFWVKVSIGITNAAFAMPLDCYVAFKRPDADQLLFYPFWSPDPSLAALEFRPLLRNCFFQNIEIAHMPSNLFPDGDYQLFAAFFEPDTFNLVGNISSCIFSVTGSPVPTGQTPQPNGPDSLTALELNQIGTPPTISIWTDKASYSAGEVLNLSLSFENQGLGVMSDLYIAAMLDADPTGTLYFFPTWATNPAFTNIGFLPLARGASLPSLTFMHLALPDALPKGGYRFLAAFFQVGTFNLASDI